MLRPLVLVRLGLVVIVKIWRPYVVTLPNRIPMEALTKNDHQ